jgi:predicted AAA+ superfamily ATPase
MTIKRNFIIPQNSFFLFGPRGTGKSTILKETFKDAVYIDLLDNEEFRIFSAYPEKIGEVVAANKEKKVVIVDEIQKVPDLLSQVHLLIETYKNKQFILTGSSARKLKKKGTNLLAGRAYKKSMHPFTANELGEDFDLLEALEYGLIPVVYDSQNKNDALDAYVDLYVREEVMMEGLTRNIGNFSRFLEAVSFSHGSQVNVSNIARECQIERKTVESYINILEDLLLAQRIPVFTKKARRNMAAHPKFYFFDTGLYRKLRPSGPLDRSEEIGGVALEGLVYQHIKAFLDNQSIDAKLFFWRTKSGSEVDFVTYGNDSFSAVEVKSSGNLRPKDFNGLKAFGEDYPMSKRIMIYMGKTKYMKDDILVIPAEEFIKNVNIVLI